ncbi:hypothetical protein BDV24DRAFT_157058 [Aspergillus arachidicola]|uniref:DUF7708 domain-containing protein n=1 Tax=Aspergillus arachidicola TaxID=656916 RepID=A0A5N6YT61_9EURO|nr:hypothetical protein BDV24DRAFT_157058 [Aspergillus arachidicola]
MQPNRQKRADSSFTLQEALNEFYKASNQKCKGAMARAHDVFQLADKANSKQSTFLEKAGTCLHSMESFAAFLDVGVTSSARKPSSLVWGCLKYLLTAALRSPGYLQKVADMFYNIGDFGDLEIRQYSTSLFTTPRVHQKIPFLYVRAVLSCARAMQAITRKRESLRYLILGMMIKPFEFSYDVSLSKFQQHRQEFLEETKRTRFMQQCEPLLREVTEVSQEQRSSSFNFGLDRDRTVMTMEEKLVAPMW